MLTITSVRKLTFNRWLVVCLMLSVTLDCIPIVPKGDFLSGQDSASHLACLHWSGRANEQNASQPGRLCTCLLAALQITTSHAQGVHFSLLGAFTNFLPTCGSRLNGGHPRMKDPSHRDQLWLCPLVPSMSGLISAGVWLPQATG